MKLSHIIVKVDNLHKAVEEYRAQGYEVEYGKEKNPYNALLYFSQGPYLELLASTGMPSAVKKLLRIFGKGKLANRLDAWDNHSGGPCGLALETYAPDLSAERAVLDRYNLRYTQMPSRRNDTKGRQLRFTCLFPDELQIPFMMTYFNIDPKPKNFVHPNGAKQITGVSFGTKEEYIPIIRQLCDDPGLTLFVGEGIKDMKIEYQTAGER